MPSPATGWSIRCGCTSPPARWTSVEQALKPILGSQLRNELGKRPFASLLSPEREGAMENIRAGLNRVSRQYGVEIVDVRIKKADLPSGTPLESAFERMRTARQQEARSIDAEGQKRAQIIRAEADAEAAQIYAAAFGKDPEFYNFYRAMQSYKTTFLPDAQGKRRADQHHPVAKQRISEGIYWTIGASTVQFAFMRLT